MHHTRFYALVVLIMALSVHSLPARKKKSMPAGTQQSWNTRTGVPKQRHVGAKDIQAWREFVATHEAV